MCGRVYTKFSMYTLTVLESTAAVLVYGDYRTHVRNETSTRQYLLVGTAVPVLRYRFLQLYGSAQSVKDVFFLSPDPANEPAQPARLATV